jgi:hypothetical protein
MRTHRWAGSPSDRSAWRTARPCTVRNRQGDGTGEDDMRESTWTVAFRKPRANRFRRVTDWSGTWHEAEQMARRTIDRDELEVWYVPTRQAELDGHVWPEDVGNILTNTGRRVRIVDNAVLTDVVPS